MEAERLRRRVTRMVETGRVSGDEAERVRTAANPGEVDDAVRVIRLRHARERLDGDVREGRMSREEADLVLERLQDGEHRGLLRDLRRRDADDRGTQRRREQPG
jgi:hypothetical protein